VRIAVAGGTGVVGRHVVEAVRAGGDEVVVLSRGAGVDLIAGTGLEAALEGVDAVVDTANVETLSAKTATSFFERATGNLVAASVRAGVRHLVVLSIVGIDLMPYDYYAGKLAQERVSEASPVPWTILRATQFHEFAGQMFARGKVGPLHVAPRARVQPVAAREVGQRLAALAARAPQGRVADLAGPREERLDDMVKAYAAHTGYRGWIPSVSLPGKQLKAMREGLALPGADATLGTQPFAEWLAALDRP